MLRGVFDDGKDDGKDKDFCFEEIVHIMRRPIIGITTSRINRQASEQEVQSVTIGCNQDYVAAVRASGGAPVLLPRGMGAEEIASVVEGLDGLLLSGGGDVHSLTYGEEPHPRSKLQDPTRDAAEFALVHAALARDLPLLGICRGLQVINVALGGTLIQDIPAQVSGASKHYSQGLEVVLLHSISINAGTLLSRLLGEQTLAVNSWHHQSINRLGEGLRINSTAADGVIEGLESDSGRPLLALQCHPEECVPTYPHFQVVFDWLVEEAAKYRERA